MARRVLVVTTANDPEEAVDSIVRGHAGDDAEVRVVAPASKISWLDWLTNDEDAARLDAAARAEAASQAAPAEQVEAEVGDVDPLRAIEDALRTFPANEVLVLTPPDQQAEWLEKGLAERARERANRLTDQGDREVNVDVRDEQEDEHAEDQGELGSLPGRGSPEEDLEPEAGERPDDDEAGGALRGPGGESRRAI
jgi:hypothetical protein